MIHFNKILAAIAITLMIICAGNVTFAASTNEMNAEAVNLLNQLRRSKGLQPLKWDPNSALQAAAQLRAEEIVQNFSHTRPDGSSCFTVLKQYGLRYSYCGENIAYGTYLSPEGAMDLWTNSPGHYKNMVSPDFREVGLACYVDGEDIYWVQVFFTQQ
ncbi:MAG: CAP domain-containing protein [Selenomonadaceae bacterium]|nr:CAP domain-containing protein [Selenomonadaceae bacterium]